MVRCRLRIRRPLATAPLSFTWIEDYEWLKRYPLRKHPDGSMAGLTEAIPWVMSDGDDLGHTQISNHKAISAGLKFRPVMTSARDTSAWRASDAVPAALRKQPRYVLTADEERAMLIAWTTKAGYR